MADYVNPLLLSNANKSVVKFREDIKSANDQLDTFIKLSDGPSIENNKKLITKTYIDIKEDYGKIIINPLIDTEKKQEITTFYTDYIQKYENIKADYFGGGRKLKKSHKKRKQYKSKKRGKSRKNKTKR